MQLVFFSAIFFSVLVGILGWHRNGQNGNNGPVPGPPMGRQHNGQQGHNAYNGYNGPVPGPIMGPQHNGQQGHKAQNWNNGPVHGSHMGRQHNGQQEHNAYNGNNGPVSGPSMGQQHNGQQGHNAYNGNSGPVPGPPMWRQQNGQQGHNAPNGHNGPVPGPPMGLQHNGQQGHNAYNGNNGPVHGPPMGRQQNGQQGHNAHNGKNGHSGHNGPGWDYGDTPTGPDNWPFLFPNQCSGPHQSPVNIETKFTVYNPNLYHFQFQWDNRTGSTYTVRNNGHDIQVDTKGYHVYGGGLRNTYRTAAFHFHWGDNNQIGSEHTIDGVEFPIELHIVNWNSDKYRSITEAMTNPDGLAVLGVLFEVSRYDNPALQPVIDALPYVRDPDWNKNMEIPAINLYHLIPRAYDRFYRYQGSLTTPPCFQSVTWTVFENTVPISERQLNVFRSMIKKINGNGHEEYSGSNGRIFYIKEQMVNNYRYRQPVNGRTIYRSFPYERHSYWEEY